MSAILDVSLDLTNTTFSKTAAGLHEIQTRALGLPPMARRLLVLVDGKRSGKELGAFVAGHDVAELLDQLLAQGCIDARASEPSTISATSATSAPAKPAAPTPPDDAAQLAGLPLAASRSAKDVEMARNFMTNTINTMFGQNMRLTLIESIFKCRSAGELRQVYPLWAGTMASIGIGAKRLPELRQKLFQVL